MWTGYECNDHHAEHHASKGMESQGLPAGMQSLESLSAALLIAATGSSNLLTRLERMIWTLHLQLELLWTLLRLTTVVQSVS